MSNAIALPLSDRIDLAYSALLVEQDRNFETYGFGLTDSDVLDAIEDYSTGSCEDACTSDDCCDYQRLSVALWAMVEANQDEEV